jgi:hypothetical protein
MPANRAPVSQELGPFLSHRSRGLTAPALFMPTGFPGNHTLGSWVNRGKPSKDTFSNFFLDLL